MGAGRNKASPEGIAAGAAEAVEEEEEDDDDEEEEALVTEVFRSPESAAAKGLPVSVPTTGDDASCATAPLSGKVSRAALSDSLSNKAVTPSFSVSTPACLAKGS